jgi:hypothetical protein
MKVKLFKYLITLNIIDMADVDTNIQEKLKEFYSLQDEGYLHRFLRDLPEADGCKKLTPLFVQDHFFRWSGIMLPVQELIGFSNNLYEYKKV